MDISRRDFLKASSLVATWTALAACTPIKEVSPGSAPRAGAQPSIALEEDALILHTLRRVTFGPTPEMIDRARRIGLGAFIEEQLSPVSIPDCETDALIGRLPTLKMTPAELLSLDRTAQPVQELIAATLLRQRHSERQLFEVMVDFWSNHFNIFIGKDLCRVLKKDDDLNVIRPHALGKFRQLLHGSAHSPAMLIFLDQAESRKEAPNENYARELLELHTISVEQGYSHHDVAEVARVLTGWTITGRRGLLREPGQFVFRPEIHDSGEKHVLGTMILPGGEDEGNILLDVLAHHPNTAQFIGQKLARRFVADDPDHALVARLAQVFSESDGDIREVLRILLASEAFKSSTGRKFKRPLEFFISALRLTGTTLNQRSRKLQAHLRLLGQVPFTWQPPDGFPDVAGYWSTTSGLLERWNFGLLLVSGRIDGAILDMKALTKDAASPADIVDVLSIRFLGEPLPADARSILVDFAASGDLDRDIPCVAGLLLGSPHFQVR